MGGTGSDQATGDRGTLLRRAGLLVGSCALTVLVADCAIGWYDGAHTDVRHLVFPPNVSLQLEVARGLLPGIEGPTRFSTNNVGLRGRRFEGAGEGPRALVLGGSTAELFYVDDDDAWPAVMERTLRSEHPRAWVGNAGRAGLTVRANTVQLRHLLEPIKPELVVVIAGINDLASCIAEETTSEYLQTQTTAALEAQLVDSVFFDVRHRFSSAILRRVAAVLRPVPRMAASQDVEGAFFEERRRNRRSATRVDVVPDIADCKRVYRERLDGLVRLAEASGANVVLLTQGSLYRADLSEREERQLWFGSVDQSLFSERRPKRYYTAAVMAELLTQMNRVVLDVCAARSLACLDVDALLPKTTESYYDDVHFNAVGSRRLGVAMGRLWLESLKAGAR
jgi:hypothetical protein